MGGVLSEENGVFDEGRELCEKRTQFSNPHGHCIPPSDEGKNELLPPSGHTFTKTDVGVV